jgi:hypothetical protein
MGSPTIDEDYSQNAICKVQNVCKGPKEEEETFMLAYKFEKPILLRGYMIKTANDCPEYDPKDWEINCRSLDGEDIIVHTVEDEAPRDRFIEKNYRCSNPIWTTGVSI